MAAIVKEIQVGGSKIVYSLEEACEEYLRILRDTEFPLPPKIHFTISIDGRVESITVRDVDTQVVAYGSFDGIPSFLDYAEEVT